MTDIIQKINKQIIDTVEQAVRTAIENKILPEIDIPSVSVEKPREKSHGDFSCNIAMILAKKAQMAPRKIAAAILENIVR